MNLHADPERETNPDWLSTGIFVRALDSRGQWGNFDIAQLTEASLRAWLQENDCAEAVVVLLLGHVTAIGPRRHG